MNVATLWKPAGSSRWRRVLLRVALYGGALFVVLPLVFAHIMTRTPARVAESPPAQGYEEVRLTSGELALRAWVVQGQPDKAAFVIVHGLGDHLESYQGHARPLIERGHTVLLLDLRGHGGSQGDYTTLGGLESLDVLAAMDYLRAEDLAESGIALMGHSMGAVAVILAAADQPNVRAVIAEAPFDSYRSTVAHHAKLMYHLPSWFPIIPLAIAAAEWRAGFDADAIDCVAAAQRIEAPFLAIADGLDRRMPEEVVSRIVDAHDGSHRLWVAGGVDHVGAFYHPDWEATILGFLDDSGL